MRKINLPSIVSKLPTDVQRFLQRIKEAVDSGDLVTASALEGAGVVTRKPDGSLIGLPQGGGEVAIDFSAPPAPQGLAATGTVTSIMLTWEWPDGYDNLAYTEIWRSGTDDFGTAVRIGSSSFITYVDTVNPMSTHYYWIRFVSLADVTGPFNRLAGTLGQALDDPTGLLSMLTNEITSEHVVSLTAHKLTSGDITGQTITLLGSSAVRAGQSAFNTGNGFWLGKDADGKARFSIGSAAGHGFDYDENTGLLNFRGTMDLKVGSMLNGAPIESVSSWAEPPGVSWNFNTVSVQNWSAIAGSVSSDTTGLTYTITSNPSYLCNPESFFSFSGRVHTKVRMVVKWVSGTLTNWGGFCYHRTTGHTYDAGQWKCTANRPVDLVPGGDYCTVIWDMTNLDPGGADWVNSTVNGIWFELGKAGDVFKVKSISIESGKINGVNIHADSSIVTGNTVPATGNKYSVLSGGDITFYDYYNDQFNPHKSLKKAVSGVVTNGQAANVGYFRNPPQVSLSPNSMMCYHAGYSGQSQKLIISYHSLARNASQHFTFVAVAQLQVYGNSWSIVAHPGVTATIDSATYTWYTAFGATTPVNANVSSISINVNILSTMYWGYVYTLTTVVTLQVYTNNWYDVDSRSFQTWSNYTVENNCTLGFSGSVFSNYRLKVAVYADGQGTYFASGTGGKQAVATITGGTFSAAATVVAADGTLNYTAVGE